MTDIDEQRASGIWAIAVMAQRGAEARLELFVFTGIETAQDASEAAYERANERWPMRDGWQYTQQLIEVNANNFLTGRIAP